MAPLTSWLDIPKENEFSLANLPFGIITSKHSQTQRRPAVAIGNHVLDLLAFSDGGGFSQLPSIQPHLHVFSSPSLNAFAALGRPVHREVRTYLQEIFSSTTSHPAILKDNLDLQKQSLLPKHETKNHLHMQIGDYTDFYAGLNHAFNVGCLFRDPATALQPNYTHLPVGYHGRASSIVISGTPIRRPNGQILLDPSTSPKQPTFSPSRRLDIELELGCFICTPNEIGSPVRIEDAESHIFGYVLLNDWSARDIQAWEYVPLGPFNSKNFGSTISQWIVLADALEPFRTAKLAHEYNSDVLPYLTESSQDTIFDISLSIDLTTPDGTSSTISQTSSKNLIWSFPQMIAHHSVGGCPMNTGDLLGSGTISGLGEKERGSLLEMNEGGKKEIMLPGMEVRKFLKDGDEINLRGICGKEGGLVGFGDCRGKIESAVVLNW